MRFFSKNLKNWHIYKNLNFQFFKFFCQIFFYKIWTECRYEKCPKTWYLLKNWSNYEHVKHAKIKKHPVVPTLLLDHAQLNQLPFRYSNPTVPLKKLANDRFILYLAIAFTVLQLFSQALHTKNKNYHRNNSLLKALLENFWLSKSILSKSIKWIKLVMPHS